MIERMILTISVVALAVLTAAGAMFAPITGTPWLDALLVPGCCIAFVLTLGGLLAIGLTIMRRVDPVWAAGGAIAIDDHYQLTLSRKRFLRAAAPSGVVSLDEVTAATWYTDLFDRSGTSSIELWDHDPQLVFGILGLTPKSGSTPLVSISTEILDGSPTATARLQHYLEHRIEAGTLDCNFSLHDFQPIPELQPPLDHGITFGSDGREIYYRTPDADEMS